jgi:hypothetical protein
MEEGASLRERKQTGEREQIVAIGTGKSLLPHPGLISAVFIFKAGLHYFYYLVVLSNN